MQACLTRFTCVPWVLMVKEAPRSFPEPTSMQTLDSHLALTEASRECPHHHIRALHPLLQRAMMGPFVQCTGLGCALHSCMRI